MTSDNKGESKGKVKTTNKFVSRILAELREKTLLTVQTIHLILALAKLNLKHVVKILKNASVLNKYDAGCLNELF